jgi:hypothetical protein
MTEECAEIYLSWRLTYRWRGNVKMNLGKIKCKAH